MRSSSYSPSSARGLCDPTAHFFAVGWLIALEGMLGGGFLLIDTFGGRGLLDPPGRIGRLHRVLAVMLIGGALVIWRRGCVRVLAALAGPAADTVVAAAQSPAPAGLRGAAPARPVPDARRGVVRPPPGGRLVHDRGW